MRRVSTLISVVAFAAGPVLAESGSGARGVVSLDAYAQGDIVDVLVVEDEGAVKALKHQRSRDGGRTWGAPSELPVPAAGLASPHRGNDVQIAARGGLVMAVFETKGASKWGGGPLATALSEDEGMTWSIGPNPADDRSADGHSFLDLAVDSAGGFRAVWLDSRDGGQGLRTSRSPDGRAWECNKTIDDRTCECCWNTLLPSDAAEMFVLYRDKDPRDMALARSGGEGHPWTRVGTAGAFGWAFDGCPHVGGGLARAADRDRKTLHATAWTGREGRTGVYWLASEDGGRTWARQRLLDPKGRHSDAAATGRAVAVTWDGGGGASIRVATSSDNGSRWSDTARFGAPGRAASHPRLFATGGGFLLVWTEAAGNGRTEWRSAIVPAPKS